MTQVATETKTQLATHQRVAVSFILGTATMVLVSVIVAAIITLTINQSATTTSFPVEGDRTFET
ncbi:MAG: hypothetical protein HYZ09_04120 [Candidatus Kerfeldbacteria bacterium]|nr:hypothetical protein [Candidatus Kerfeldbacteria bacterium]